MDTEIRNAVSAADASAQYDESAKRLLGNKSILAHILVKTVDEFRGMDPQEAVSYIEGEPFIGVVPVEPGLTNVKMISPGADLKNGQRIIGLNTEHAEINEGLIRFLSGTDLKNGQRIVGLNTEHAEINEGLIRFDIIFYVRMKDGISQVIVNVEAQKDEPGGYHILNRAVFYVSRLVSSQKERDFVRTNYNDIKRVFSIWVCMNMDENSMAYVHLAKDDLLGSYQWKGGLDLLNIVLIGIADKLQEQDSNYELHRLLSTLLSMELSPDEKLGIMENEYRIAVDDRMRKDVSAMCNLSQGIMEKGIAQGMAQGMAQGRAEGRAEREKRIILNMYQNNFTLEQIALATSKDVEEIKEIIEKRELVLV